MVWAKYLIKIRITNPKKRVDPDRVPCTIVLITMRTITIINNYLSYYHFTISTKNYGIV